MSIEYIKISGAQTDFNGKYLPCSASISSFDKPSQVRCKKCDSDDDDDNKYCIFLHKITERWIICKTKFDPKLFYYVAWDSQSNEPTQSGWKYSGDSEILFYRTERPMNRPNMMQLKSTRVGSMKV